MGSRPRERRRTQAARALWFRVVPHLSRERTRNIAKRCATLSNVEQSKRLVRRRFRPSSQVADWTVAHLQGGGAGFDTQSAHGERAGQGPDSAQVIPCSREPVPHLSRGRQLVRHRRSSSSRRDGSTGVEPLVSVVAVAAPRGPRWRMGRDDNWPCPFSCDRLAIGAADGSETTSIGLRLRSFPLVPV
jgi:hypothetical protein